MVKTCRCGKHSVPDDAVIPDKLHWSCPRCGRVKAIDATDNGLRSNARTQYIENIHRSTEGMISVGGVPASEAIALRRQAAASPLPAEVPHVLWLECSNPRCFGDEKPRTVAVAACEYALMQNAREYAAETRRLERMESLTRELTPVERERERNRRGAFDVGDILNQKVKEAGEQAAADLDEAYAVITHHRAPRGE